MRFPPAIPVFIIAASAACSDAPQRAVFPVYDPATRQLIRLDYDYDANGVVDVRTHMHDGRAVKLEGDTDRDGQVDRWEYYDADGQLARIGGSSQADGIEDTWAFPSGENLRMESSSRRDGTVDRREFYTGNVLQRVEIDANHDGQFDTWEQYENGRLAAKLIDEQFNLGRPTRRILYGPTGAPRVEVDPDGDGQFGPLEQPASPVPQEGSNVAR